MADITLITGSTLGSAEYVAEHLEEKLQDAGFSTAVLHGPELDEVPQEGIWLIVTSTHGAGELPDNLLPFYEALKETQPDLSAVRFGAVGIGNHEYDLFCGAIRTLEDQLNQLGAKRIGDRLEIDVLEHEIPEDPAEVWLASWQTQL
ncbi:FMN-binding protein MioC [Erwiniaceae bacterium L1_54_6]|jgi:MioC protein|uniref:FMN-binding protein MioC n=1 Tax=Pantoea cypripedii TaxID=55209 RepID=A0A6B9G109_PANCY|nr:FMN-binding protein MioC [Pantoea cypripedii]MDF7661176.1 FMN-binding protein MioC [Erwiniaceae bacterium L1_54_6]QGY31111.1 FMN-binding protein MioC [Pantoea cypripedii]